MLAFVAIVAVLCCFTCCWCYIMARNPREWRLWWMNFFGYLDLNSTRDQRRTQEGHLRLFAYLTSFMCLVVAVTGTFWVVTEVQEKNENKTPLEKDQAMTLKHLEKTRGMFRKLR